MATGGCSNGLLIYMFCLAVFQLPFARLVGFCATGRPFWVRPLQAMGGVLDVRWAHSGIVTTGHYCTGQGILEQIGQPGVALTPNTIDSR